jgi:hypothetical protein
MSYKFMPDGIHGRLLFSEKRGGKAVSGEQQPAELPLPLPDSSGNSDRRFFQLFNQCILNKQWNCSKRQNLGEK